MSEINVSINGNVVGEPVMVPTKTGVAMCSLRVAVNSRKFDKVAMSWLDGDTTYFNVTSWRGLAENVGSSVKKGDPVVVVGKLKVREWSKDEKSGTSVEIEAASIGHDLSRGSSAFTRVSRSEFDGFEAAGGISLTG
jgi:single-strand DNA-binding protein